MDRRFVAPVSRPSLVRRLGIGLGLLAACTLGAGAFSDAAAGASAGSIAAQAADGEKVFQTYCASCHMATGAGVPGAFPPLVGSEWVTGDEQRLVRVILHGLSGPIEVAGKSYTGVMPGWGGVLKDPEVAAVATYVRNSWGNKASAVSADAVAEIRKADAARKTPWTAAELEKLK